VSYKRVVISQFGDADVLRLIEEPTLPEPGPGEVRVKVTATSASFVDTLVRRGKYPGIKKKMLPFSPGFDMVGVVDKLGEDVVSPRFGWRVVALTVTGAYSQYICLPAERVVPVPEVLSATEAVSLVLSYVAAYQMLRRVAKVEPGERMLVHGAGGAVGTALLQLGQAFGLEVYGTASSGKQELIKGLGAVPIDYHNEDFVELLDARIGDGIDVVFDGIGGDNLTRSFSTLRRGGRLVAFGFYNAMMGRGGSIPLDLAWVRLWNALPNGRLAAYYSIVLLQKRHPDWFRDDLGVLYDMLARGRIRPVISAYLPLGKAADAHRLVESAALGGRVMLMVAEGDGADRV